MVIDAAAADKRQTQIAPAIACMLSGSAVLTLNDALIKSIVTGYPRR